MRMTWMEFLSVKNCHKGGCSLFIYFYSLTPLRTALEFSKAIIAIESQGMNIIREMCHIVKEYTSGCLNFRIVSVSPHYFFFFRIHFECLLLQFVPCNSNNNNKKDVYFKFFWDLNGKKFKRAYEM